MADILFATWDGGGNVPPATGIAVELQERGHRIQFLGHAGNRAAVTAAGLPSTPYQHALPFSSAEPNGPERMVEIFNDAGIAADVVSEAVAMSADVVVVDCLLLAALGEARAAGLVYVPLEHFFDAYYRERWLKAPFGQAAEARGHDPFGALADAPLTIAATLRELDPAGQSAHPSNLVFSGPVLRAPAPRDLAGLPANVLVSLSTYNFPGQTAAMQTILDAVTDLPAHVVVTTGPAIDGSKLHVPDGVEVHEYVDHDSLMPEITLLIGHGGHATTMRALAHDIPMAVMPQHPMLDQTMVGQVVEAAGAGRLLPREASAHEVRAVIDELIVDGPHRTAAAQLGKTIREARGASVAADRIEALTATEVDSIQ